MRDDKIQIIDEHTGRVMADRAWERGLHQMIECKENVELTSNRETLARISYQRFFRRYLRLGGMSGTLEEVRGELWSVYGLGVVTVPTDRPVIRIQRPDRTYRRAVQKWTAIVKRIRAVHQRGRPVLVGTGTVEDSELLSRLLKRVKLEHQVLNAHQDEQEAEIVACAGEKCRITVATNMAGRGQCCNIKFAKKIMVEMPDSNNRHPIKCCICQFAIIESDWIELNSVTLMLPAPYALLRKARRVPPERAGGDASRRRLQRILGRRGACV